MPFFIELSDQDEAYLASREELSEHGITKAFARLEAELGDATQQFRDERRLEPGSPYFEYGMFLSDGGRYHHIRCVVDDSHAVHGVLRIVYIEHTLGKEILPL